MAKGLAWREGVEEGLAVEVTCAGFSYRYTGCQAFSGRVAGTPGTLRGSGQAAGGPQIGQRWSARRGLQTPGKGCILPVLSKGLNAWQ